MSYSLKSVTIRSNNSESGMKQVDELWKDIFLGKLPLLFDSEGNLIKGLSPISVYSNYASNEHGDFDLSVTGVCVNFFEELEKEVLTGKYKKYDFSADTLQESVRLAWQQVWDDKKSGVIRRAYTTDYESAVPAEYTKDGKAHCYLYIAVK